MVTSIGTKETEVIERVKELLKEHGRLEINIDDPSIVDLMDTLRKSKVRFHLVKNEEIVVDFNEADGLVSICRLGEAATEAGTATKTTKKKATKAKAKAKPNAKKKVKVKHTYVKPKHHERMKRLIQSDSALVVCGTGPTGCGKTHHMRLMAEELDMKLILVNCKKDMDTASFLGDKTIDVDETSGQNYIKFLEGPVVQALKTGLDEQGNETGRPALLVIDEFPIIPSWIAIGLNNLLENNSARRKVTLDNDGGRVVTGHSGCRIVLLGNTIGKGLTGTRDAQYVAQGDALDISTLDRIDAIFRYGYSKRAEESILREKVGDDRLIKKMLKFRDGIRSYIKQGEASTPFSTRLIVSLADLYREYNGDLAATLYDGVFTKLIDDSPDPSTPGGELALYNEQAIAVFGIDVLEEVGNDPDMDYM